MTRWGRRTATLAAVTALVGAAAGCGGDSSAPPSGRTAHTTAASGASGPASSAASTSNGVDQQTTSPAPRAPALGYGAALSKIAHQRVRVGRHVYRVNPHAVICNGEGRARRESGRPRWSRFVCTQTTFGVRDRVDRDISFDVVVHGGGRVTIERGRPGAF